MKNGTNNFAGAGIVTAVAASLCCITPVLALISGASGIAATFSWLEPLRPWFIGITLLVLTFAWYQKLKPVEAEAIQCDCEEEKKRPFLHSKLFLGIVTLFAAIMIAFPYYSSLFYRQNQQKVVVVKQNDLSTLRLRVEGMTCEACNYHIEHEVSGLEGVLDAKADYKSGEARITYDKSKTDKSKIVEAINKTDYTVAGEKRNRNNQPYNGAQ